MEHLDTLRGGEGGEYLLASLGGGGGGGGLAIHTDPVALQKFVIQQGLHYSVLPRLLRIAGLCFVFIILHISLIRYEVH